MQRTRLHRPSEHLPVQPIRQNAATKPPAHDLNSVADPQLTLHDPRSNAVMRQNALQQMQNQHGNAYTRRALDTKAAIPARGSQRGSVQRFGVSDVTSGLSSAYDAASGAVGSAVQAGENAVSQALPSGTISFLTNAASSARGLVGEATQWGQSYGPQAVNGIHQQAGTMHAGTQQAAAQSQQAGQQLQSGAQQATAQIGQGRQTMQQTGSRAAAQVGGLGPTARTLASPVSAATKPQQTAAAKGTFTSVGQGVGSSAAGAVDPTGGQSTWDCSEASILNKVSEGAEEALNVVEGIPGVGDVVKFGADMAGRARNGIAQVTHELSQMASGAKTWLTQQAQPLIDMGHSALTTLEDKYNTAKNAVSQKAGEVRDFFVSAWNQGRDSIVNTVHQKAQQIRNGINNGINGIRNFLGGLGTALLALLPQPLRNLVGDLGGMINDAERGLETAKQAVIDEAVAIKNEAISDAKAVGDAALQTVAQDYQDAKHLAHDAVALAREEAHNIADATPDWIKQPVADAEQWVTNEAGQVKDAVTHEAAALGGEVCSVIDDVASPCVDRLLPAVPDATNAVKLTAAADATVPLEEVGVPANLQVKQGSSIEISRAGKTFTVTIAGEGAVYLTEDVGESGGVQVTTPGGAAPGAAGADASGHSAAVWNKLASGGGGAPTPGGGAAPGAGSGGGAGDSVTANVKAGIKGTVTTKYAFTMGGTNCDGIGGMVGLLATYGVAQSLPAPFSGLATAAGQAAFAGNMTSCLFSLAGSTEGAVELKGGDIASLKAAASADITQTTGVQRDANGNMVTVNTLALGAKISGDGSAQLPGMKDILKLGEAGEGSVKLTLSFLNDQIQPTTLVAQAKGSITISSTADLGPIRDLIPGGAAAAAETAIKDSLKASASDKIEATATFTVRDLNPLFAALELVLLRSRRSGHHRRPARRAQAAA